jgi:hypothetical protein
MALACKNHPRSLAEFTCFDCHQPICEACLRTRDDGTIVCSACTSGLLALADEPAYSADGPPANPCAGHPGAAAVAVCHSCQARICNTCDFAFENLHLCPQCAVLNQQAMTPQRKTMGIWGLVLGVINVPISVVGFVILRILPELGRELAAAVNVLSSLTLVICLGVSVFGLLLGLHAFERKSANPGYLWIGPVLNGLIGVFWVLLLTVGMLAMAQR